MLQIDNTVLLIIDIQGKLASLMHKKDRLFENTERILRAAKVLGLEVICTEQYPDGLGATVPQIAEHVDVEPISKLAFSCCGEEAFQTALKQTGRKQVLIAGIETHICVYQTTMDLLADGYQVYVLTDAVSSRTKANRKLGLERMKEAGVTHTSVEMALFEMLKIAKGDQFKEIARIVK
ncbi:MAG: hydrolase [Phycisphaerae bacterium]|jgi:nicotinamidase-related amidase|nr:hydrolase [Phycisphaerae bacterium]